MTGEKAVATLLREMKPTLRDGEFVFCSVPGTLREVLHLAPEGCFWEAEGLSLILRREAAETEGLVFGGIYRLITLGVHSSLNAVGFLAKISGALAAKGISFNPVAAYYHDHLFVPADRARDAMNVLR
ncbi:MAG: ACT domain-containing protein, partial [Desulfococcaceae bacterium]